MAQRNLRIVPDDILRKHSKPVTKFDEKLHQLLDDMAETMYEAGGVGLAAVQVGILRQVIIIDITDEQNSLTEIINPRIIHSEGIQEGKEGCLSIPERSGLVERPKYTTIIAQNRYGEEFELKTDEYMCIALNHEIDHLKGILYTDIAKEIYNQPND